MSINGTLDVECPCGENQMTIDYESTSNSKPVFCPFCGTMMDLDFDETEDDED